MKWSDIFEYRDGKLYNRHTRQGQAVGGCEAGSVKPSGYAQVCFDRKMYMVHRIVYEMHYGDIPDGMVIDHKDGNPLNNNIENLRITTPSGNSKNRKRHENNSSGVTGVCWHKKAGKWLANIRVNGRLIHLGWFANLDDAIAVRREAEVKHGFSARHGK